MSEEVMSDDSTHYEVSLTAGQAFVAFVLLLLSLAASFAFGLMIGRGQVNDRLVVKREPSVINEAAAPPSNVLRSEARIVELGVEEEPEENAAVAGEEPKIIEEKVTAPAAASVNRPPAEAHPVVASEPKPPQPKAEAKEEAKAAPVIEEKKPASLVKPVEKKPELAQAVYAQLLSTGEARTAESLAARLIDAGFTTAYVERSVGNGAMIYRVRVRFASEELARASADRLRSIAKAEPWITKQ